MFDVTFDPQSTREDWTFTLLIEDEDTGNLVDLTGDSFTLAIRSTSRIWPGTGYVSVAYPSEPTNYDLIGSTSTGEITLPSLGTVTTLFPASTMRRLSPGSYDVGMTVTNGISTKQVLHGTLNLYPGGVP